MQNKIISSLQDLRYLQWSKIRRSSGTAGSFLKAQETVRRTKWYFKLSDFDPYEGIIGHECVNEIIADRLLTLLQIPHVPYQLIHARILIDEQEYTTWLCRSADFKKRGESKLALDTFYQLERLEKETPLDFCIRQGWGDYIWQMLLIDFLILNRDRHGANMEVLRNREEHTLRLAPLFDQGLSFYFSAHDESELAGADPLADKKVQCFVGSRSAFENLKLIPEENRVCPAVLSETDRTYLFAGLEEALSPAYRDAVWNMIWERWNYYESFCHS